MLNSNYTAHYHGCPIWGNKGEVHSVAVRGAGAFISYARPEQIIASLSIADDVAIDNAAFSAWKNGLVINWVEFYKWLMKYYFHDKMRFFIIPDKIDGTEEENNELIASVPKMFMGKATPVWHLHESLYKLDWLCGEYDRVAFGSSAEYSTVRSKLWKVRIHQAFELMYRNNHKTKIHGLRMLDGRVFGNYPLHTADSTNLACNVPKWKVKYPDIGRHILDRPKILTSSHIGKDGELVENYCLTKYDKNELLIHRCATLKGAIEKVMPPTMTEYMNNLCHDDEF